jgi:hypothetical protein
MAGPNAMAAKTVVGVGEGATSDMKTLLSLLLSLVALHLSGCNGMPIVSTPSAAPQSTLIALPKIDRHPSPANYHRGAMASVPTYDPNSDDYWQMDLRAYDLSALDLSGSLNDLLYVDFDDRTAWPPDDRMPQGFDWQRIIELGKDPGLGIHDLHAQGITGRGVSIAIIDQPLLTEHQEYTDRLQLYEEINVESTTRSQMHGPAVASIAVGETTGVAPDADLYYIGSWTGDRGVGAEGFTWNFIYYAQAIRRILEINSQLAEDRRIRVVSMQVGWNPEQAGYDEITAAVQEAKAAGMLVICSCVDDETVHGFKFNGLGRDPLADPNLFESYEPGLFWAKYFPDDERVEGRLLVPMDSRTTASPLGNDEYVFYRQGGWSWSIPYIAGVYALAVQVDPAITPEQFWALAMETGHTVELEHNDETIPLGPIIHPVALIDALKSD